MTARQCVLETFRGEGVRGFFKGLAPPVLSGSFVNSGIFFGYGLGMAVLEPNVNRASNAAPQSYLNVYLAGCCGGFVQCHIVTPVELVKVKLQAQTDSGAARKYKGSFDCARQIVRANGLAGLYRGYHSLLIREVPSYGLYFATYEWGKQAFAPGKTVGALPCSMHSLSLPAHTRATAYHHDPRSWISRRRLSPAAWRAA